MKPVVILLVVAVFVVCSGCTGTPVVRDTADGALHAHYQYKDDWSPVTGCYGHVTGYVYNAGNVSDENVRLNFNLVNAGTGTIRDSRSIFIPSIGPGATTTYETMLDGECSQGYRVDFSFEK